jgi:hypothetical protein
VPGRNCRGARCGRGERGLRPFVLEPVQPEVRHRGRQRGFRRHRRPGQAVILAAAAPSTTEDWTVSFDGTVNDFFSAGLINATLDAHYGPDAAYEFQYQPGGISSGLCLGIASGPAQGTKVNLQPCGVTVNTIWINDAADGSGGYAPYVSGSDTQYPAPFVLTASKVGGHFTTRALKTNKKGVIAKDQMWQLISGVLP